MNATENLPVEITEAFTDLGHPFYEWVVNGHFWDHPLASTLLYYSKQRLA